MDVILLQSVERVGTEGTVVRVKPGFARNYLFPRGLAAAATPERLERVETRRQAAQRKSRRERERLEQLKRRLEARSLTIKLNVGAGGKAFGSVTAHDIAEALRQEQLPVDKHLIALDDPIKTLGIYPISIRLHPEMTATLQLWVVKA